MSIYKSRDHRVILTSTVSFNYHQINFRVQFRVIFWCVFFLLEIFAFFKIPSNIRLKQIYTPPPESPPKSHQNAQALVSPACPYLFLIAILAIIPLLICRVVALKN